MEISKNESEEYQNFVLRMDSDTSSTLVLKDVYPSTSSTNVHFEAGKLWFIYRKRS